MAALLLIATLGMLILGCVVMKRLDAFIDGGGVGDSPQGRFHCGFLVYGSLSDAARFRKEGFKCTETIVPDIPAGIYYAALFALAEDDETNLQVCRAAKRGDPGICIIARCHSPALLDVYRSVGADYILRAGEEMNGILAGMKEVRYEE